MSFCWMVKTEVGGPQRRPLDGGSAVDVWCGSGNEEHQQRGAMKKSIGRLFMGLPWKKVWKKDWVDDKDIYDSLAVDWEGAKEPGVPI